MSFQDAPIPFPEVGAAAVPRIVAANPRVFACFVRNKNGNVVVLEGQVSGGKLVGVEGYWLDLDAAFRAKARATGKRHDRDAFNMLDQRAYGFRVDRVNDTTLSLVFNQLPQKTLQVRLEGGHQVHAYTTLQGQLCRLQYIYVHAQGLLPRVEYVEVHGLSRHKQHVVEKLKQ